MPREFHTDVDLKGVLLLKGSAGTLGYVLKSQGAGQPPVWAAESAGVTAGDKGDIIVDASGNWTIDSTVCTSAGRALIDDASAAAQRTTLGVASYAITLALC